MAATMKNWLGPRLDEEIEKTLLQAKKKKEALTENVDSQEAESQIYLKIPFQKGGLVQIVEFLGSKDQTSAILSDSYSSILAVLEPQAILDAEKARSGGGRITQNTEGGVMGIKDFDIFLVVTDDGGLRIGARVRHLRLMGSEGSSKFGSPVPLNTRDPTVKLFKQWVKVARKDSKSSPTERDTSRFKAQGDLKDISGETNENSHASSKRFRAQRHSQKPTPDTWKGKSKLSKHDVTIPKDQEKILGRKDSWIPVDDSQQAPAARLPLKLLQYFSEQAIAKSKEALEAPSLIDSAPAEPLDVLSSSSSKPDATEIGSDVASPINSVNRLEETARNVDGIQEDSGNDSDFSIASSEWPLSPSQQTLKNQLPPDSSDEGVYSSLKDEIRREKTGAISQPLSKSNTFSKGIDLEGCSLLPNGEGEATEIRNKSINSKNDRDSIASQIQNFQDLPNQFDDGLESTSASQKILTSIIHQVSSQVTTVNESPAKPRPAGYQLIDGLNSESQSEPFLNVIDYCNISADGETQAQSATVACSGGEKKNIESEDEMSVELEMSVPMSLDQQLGNEGHKIVDRASNRKFGGITDFEEEKLLSIVPPLEALAENSSDRARPHTPRSSRPHDNFLGILSDQSQHDLALQFDRPQEAVHDRLISDQIQYDLALQFDRPREVMDDELISDQIQQTLLYEGESQPDTRVIEELNPGHGQDLVYDEEMIDRQLQMDIESSSQIGCSIHHRSPSIAKIDESLFNRPASLRLTTPMKGMIPRRPPTSASKITLPLMTPLKRKVMVASEDIFNFNSAKRRRNGSMAARATHYQSDGCDGHPSGLVQQSMQTAKTNSDEADVDVSLSRELHHVEPRNSRRKTSNSGLYHFSSNGQLAAVRYFEDPNVYEVFQNTYPQFGAPLDRFVMPCVLLERRSNSGNPVHKFLWDDYVGRFSSDFEKWSYGISFDDYYDEFVEEPIYTKKVLGPSNIQEALELDPKTATFMRSNQSKKQNSTSRSGSEPATPDPFLEKLQRISMPDRETREAKARRREGYDSDQGSHREVQESIPSSISHSTISKRPLEKAQTPLHEKSRRSHSVTLEQQSHSSTAVPRQPSRAKSRLDRSFGDSESLEDLDAIPISENYKSSTHSWEPKDLVSGKFRSPGLPQRLNGSTNSATFVNVPSLSDPDTQIRTVEKSYGRKEKVQVIITKSSGSSQESSRFDRTSNGSPKDDQQNLLNHQRASLNSSSIPPSGQHPGKATKKPTAQISAQLDASKTSIKTGKHFRPPMSSTSKSKPSNLRNQQQSSSARLPVERPSLSRPSGSSSSFTVPPQPASLQQQQQRREQIQPSGSKLSSSNSKPVPVAPVVVAPIPAGQTPKTPHQQAESVSPERWWQDRKTPFKDFVNYYSKLRVEKGRLGHVDRETGLLVPPSRSQGGSGHKIDVLSWGDGL